MLLSEHNCGKPCRCLDVPSRQIFHSFLSSVSVRPNGVARIYISFLFFFHSTPFPSRQGCSPCESFSVRRSSWPLAVLRSRSRCLLCHSTHRKTVAVPSPNATRMPCCFYGVSICKMLCISSSVPHAQYFVPSPSAGDSQDMQYFHNEPILPVYVLSNGSISPSISNGVTYPRG